MTEPRECACGCGVPIQTHAGKGRPGRYASGACRIRAFRAKAAVTNLLAQQATGVTILPPTLKLQIVPCTIDQANAFVERIHRHHKALRVAKFAVAVADSSGLVRGVAIVARPCSRHLDDGATLEVARLATDGAHNACSMLYGASWRAARALGYRKMVTYTIPEEGGASLRASGWRQVGKTKGDTWQSGVRQRSDKHPVGVKWRWEVTASIPEIAPRFPEDEQASSTLWTA